MDDKQNNSSSRRYNNHIDEELNHQQIRRRSSITTEQTLSSNNQDFIYNRNIPMLTNIPTRKRSAQDDMITYTTHHFLREHEQCVRNSFISFFSIEYTFFWFIRLINELDMNN